MDVLAATGTAGSALDGLQRGLELANGVPGRQLSLLVLLDDLRDPVGQARGGVTTTQPPQIVQYGLDLLRGQFKGVRHHDVRVLLLGHFGHLRLGRRPGWGHAFQTAKLRRAGHRQVSVGLIVRADGLVAHRCPLGSGTGVLRWWSVRAVRRVRRRPCRSAKGVGRGRHDHHPHCELTS